MNSLLTKSVKGNFSNVRITEKLLKNNPNFSDLLLKMSHKTEKQKETYEEEEKIIISEISEILSDFRLYQMNMEQYQKFPLKNTENIYLELENFYLAFTTFDKLKLSKNETEKINLLGIHFQKPDLKSLSIEVKREIDFRIDQKLLKISSFFSLDSMDELENFLMERKLKEISNQEIENENNENYSVKLQEKYKKLLKSMKDIAKFVQQYKIENSKLKEEFILSLQSKIKFFELKVEILKLDTLNEVYSEEVSQLLSKI
eukprot:gene11622-4864_t